MAPAGRALCCDAGRAAFARPPPRRRPRGRWQAHAAPAPPATPAAPGPQENGTGVYHVRAKSNPMYTYRETLSLGPTVLDSNEVRPGFGWRLAAAGSGCARGRRQRHRQRHRPPPQAPTLNPYPYPDLPLNPYPAPPPDQHYHQAPARGVAGQLI
jgi:hypothetical protein